MSDKRDVTLDRGWGILLKDLGIEAENVLRRAGLPRDLMGREQAKLTVEEYFGLWEALDAEADDPILPIRLGRAATPEVFHPAIFAALCSPNLIVAIQRIAQYKRLCAPVTLVIDEEEEGLSIAKRWDDPTVVIPKTLATMELVFLTQIARIGTREPIRPLRIESSQPLQPLEAYVDFFGVKPVRSKRHRVVFTWEDARRPFLTASESVWQTFEPELQRRLTTLEASAPLSARVRSVLLESLPSGESSVDVVAKRLGLSTRTLQRKLKPEGVSFKDIVNSTRKDLARHYVTKTSLAYPEISFLIGFEEPSSFFRAFREWTGKTPEAFRLAAATSL